MTTFVNKKRLIKRFIHYVEISSLSGEEQEFSSVLRGDLKKLGIKSSRDKIGNLFAKVKGTIRSVPTLMLNAHLDTVSPGKNIKPILKNGIIKSDGKTVLGADDKAGVAAIIEALTVLKENRIPHGDILLVFTVQEEIGLVGAKAINHKKVKADYGLVLDGGEVSKIINQAPSQHNLNVEILGRAAHAGVHPEDGINAIVVASEAISKMKLGRIDRETTANIGIIEGGRATNIIPEKVTIKGEARSHNLKKLKMQNDQMSKCLIAACRKYKARLKLKIIPVYKAFNISRREKILKIVDYALRNLGIKSKVAPSGGGSDANIFNRFGIKSVIVGVGAEKIHTKKEKIKIKNFVMGTRSIIEVIKLCSSGL